MNESIAQYGPGDVVVLRGLRTNPKQSNSALIGPRIGKIVTLLPEHRYYVRLLLGSPFRAGDGRGHFAPRGRAVEHGCVVRPATRREIALGSPDLAVAS